MSYHVYLGGRTIYGAEGVDLSLARPVKVYNGLEAGEFPIPDDKKLRQWIIKGQWTERDDFGCEDWEPAHALVKALGKLMDSREPERLVISGEGQKTSTLVLLTGLDTEERDAGVYAFTLKATEYRKAQKKTAGVPVIDRPGKAPDPPKERVFTSAAEVADITMQQIAKIGAEDRSGEDLQNEMTYYQNLAYSWTDAEGRVHRTGNPNLVPLNQKVSLGVSAPEGMNVPEGWHYNPYIGKVQPDETPLGKGVRAVGSWAKETFAAMSEAYEKWAEQNK